MAIRTGLAFGLIAFAAAGCSTIIEGTSQDITLTSVPSEAACTVQKNGVTIATVNKTPGRVTVDKSSADLTVVCNKEGFKETRGILESDLAAATFGNAIAGGLIGVVIDASTGANSKYDDTITVRLLPETPATDATPSAAAPADADADATADTEAAPAAAPAGGMQPIANPPSS